MRRTPGKSTLTNALVGQKVAIVSAKAQTTRARLLGIALAGGTQIILADTPGIFAPKRRLDRAMVSAAWEGTEAADAILLVVDSVKRRRHELEPLLEALAHRPERKLLVLNKVDTAVKEELLVLAQDLTGKVAFDEVFFVSALSGDGVEQLKAHLAGLMPEGPWHYPEDQVSDASERLLAAEITREQLYRQLREELPYDSAVRPESYTLRKDGSVEVRQQIVVGRETQRAIVLGKGGSRIKAIGEAARQELAGILGQKVHLFLHVKVDENWAESREIFEEIGLDWVTLKRALTLVAPLLLAGCMHTSQGWQGARYVAMGSSFASGPGLATYKPATPERCARSTVNYASLLAESLDLQLVDASCSGATTEHLLGAWNELPPQLDAVTADTRLVTVTIGGNDLRYIGNLFAASCRVYGELRPGEPCPVEKAPTEADYAQVRANLLEIAHEVHRRAPDATLVFVQYTSLVSANPCAAEPVDPAGAELARKTAANLAAITAQVALEAKAMLLPLDRLSATHTPCDAQPWATGFPPGFTGVNGAPWHPNAAGMQATAGALVRLLEDGSA